MSFKFKGKLITYIAPGLTQQEEVKKVKYQIRNTRQEETFMQFQNPNSLQSLLCELTAEDDFLRVLFFIKPEVSLQPVKEYPLVFRYSLFLDFDEKFLGSIFDEPTKKIIEDMKKSSEDVIKSVKDISSKLVWKFFTVAATDKQIRDRLTRKRTYIKAEEMNEVISGVVKRRENEFERIMGDWTDVFSSMYYAQEYYLPIIQAYEELNAAKENLDLLSNSLIVLDFPEALRNALSKLIGKRIFRIKITSLCLECRLRKGFEPYSMIQKYPLEPALDVDCSKCGGRSIYHQIEMEAPHAFGPLFKENTIQEFIVGYTLARSELIKKVYVHKKINVITKKGPLPGLQVNIFAVTTDDKILIVEVTTSKNLNRVMQEVDKKLDALKDFPYDHLVFITPIIELKEYIDYKNVRIFGSRHIPKIASNIEYLLGAK
jgi:hypothetical protein